ncbi:MAG: hypothetical protein Q7O66_20310, partial [Dehalococcoidia bacterium]|nr:hypothetical protein [Dehalococcoidia bacterium]
KVFAVLLPSRPSAGPLRKEWPTKVAAFAFLVGRRQATDTRVQISTHQLFRIGTWIARPTTSSRASANASDWMG